MNRGESKGAVKIRWSNKRNVKSSGCNISQIRGHANVVFRGLQVKMGLVAQNVDKL